MSITKPYGCQHELINPKRYVTSLWWCKIFHKGDIFEQLENLTNFEISCNWENFPIISQCQVFANVKIFQHKKYLHSQTAYVHAIMTPYDSCNRVACKVLIQHTVSTDMYHSSATHTVATVYVSKKQEVTGVDGGTKNNWRGRLLKYTDEFNEWTYKCNLCAKENIRKLTRKFNNLPRPLEVGLRHRKLIPKG